MAPSFITKLLMLILCICPSFAISSRTDFLPSECLMVPTSEFVNSVKDTIDAVQQVASIISPFVNLFGDLRLSSAISDCLDLLELSSDELTWSLSATQNPKGKDNSTGDKGSDLRTWLSAALVNQDTCIDGFDGTSSIVKELVSGGLTQVTSLVQQLLSMVQHPVSKNPGRRLTSKDQFPSWVKSEDRKLLQANGVVVDAIVAADGSGNFTMFIGDGMDATVISGDRNYIDGWTTFRTATFAVSGRGFIARDITFENTAGPEKHQAVALRSDSDLSVFFRCGIKGYQDSLYTHTMRQFYRECRISGTVDFIFGDGTVVFQNCQILAKKGLPNQKEHYNRSGSQRPNPTHGLLLPILVARVEWHFAFGYIVLRRIHKFGPSGSVARRVNWPGYHVFNESSQAHNFTVAQFIEGNLWLPPTGVRYTAGLEV
ncbi:hypothetical protein SLA2020_339300 [Shorea laevis]